MLLDREDELADCDRGLEAAREGQGALLLVEAGAGMGKTMLLAELRERARAVEAQSAERAAEGARRAALTLMLFEHPDGRAADAAETGARRG